MTKPKTLMTRPMDLRPGDVTEHYVILAVPTTETYGGSPAVEVKVMWADGAIDYRAWDADYEGTVAVIARVLRATEIPAEQVWELAQDLRRTVRNAA